jgi:aminoglycoside phosphotransferase (APT) family kinase protein
MLDLSDPTLTAMLRTALDRFVAPFTRVTAIDTLPIDEGVSGARINRVGVSYTSTNGSPGYTQFVLKKCPNVERRVLARLQAPPRHVPYSVSATTDNDGRGVVCMQELGMTQRPDSLSPITPELQRREAQALADIHANNLNAPDLGWLPTADRSDYQWAIEQQFFRWAWDKAIANSTFTARFVSYLEAVQETAAHIVDEMVDLGADPRWTTLVHTDINPSNVLVLCDQPYIIDWDTARQGPLFLDLPHHLSTRDQAEDYRLALGTAGVQIDPDEFSSLYRIAARYTGLRYIWWTLEAWHSDPAMDIWVEHYLRMITT